MSAKVYICSSFGNCEYNNYHTTQIGAYFRANGYEIDDGSGAPDFVVVNTCGVDQFREDNALDIIRECVDKFGVEKVIVAGCLTKISPALESFSGIRLIPPKELSLLDDMIGAVIPFDTIRENVLNKGQLREGDEDSEKKYYIKISEGCANKCTYCAITNAKGFVSSKAPDDIAREFEEGVNSGLTDISFLADDCGSYGMDIGTDFAALLNKLLPLMRPETRIFIHYMEPRRMLNVVPFIKQEVFSHISFLHVPMQSIVPRILKLMNRHYDMDEVFATIKMIKTLNSSISTCSNILFGFPGETREEFERYFGIMEHFDSALFYCYSPRHNTKAADFPDKIDREEIAYRVSRVIEESKKNKGIILAYDDLSELGFGNKKKRELFIYR